jgi:8-oxo-dGTP pyrophosphatase MutT (NUDIX family)
VRVEEIIGQRTRERRTALELTQEAAADRVSAHLNREWTRQAWSAAEKGKRSFTASELVAIAHALGTTVAWLMSPPEGVEDIELGDGAYLPAPLLVSALIPQITSGRSLNDVIDAIYRLRLHASELGGATASVNADIEALAKSVVAAAAPYVELEADNLRGLQPIAVAVITAGKKVLITRRKDDVPPWGFLAGEVEPGEQAGDTVVRESKEEAGIEIRVTAAIGARNHPVTGRHMIYLAGRPVALAAIHVGEKAELAEVKWASLEEAVELMPSMFGPVRAYLEHALIHEGGRP